MAKLDLDLVEVPIVIEQMPSEGLAQGMNGASMHNRGLSQVTLRQAYEDDLGW